MPEFENPAGRLSVVLGALQQKASGNIKDLALILGTPGSFPGLLQGIKDLQFEFGRVVSLIDDIPDERQRNFYARDFPSIEQSINSFRITYAQQQYNCEIQPSAVTALRYMSSSPDLTREQGTSPDEIERLRALCDELRKQIGYSVDLDKALKVWLLDLVRMMEDGIDSFTIRGADGFKHRVYEMIGSLICNYPSASAVNVKSPDLASKIKDGFDLCMRIAERSVTVASAIEYANKAIAMLTGLNPEI